MSSFQNTIDESGYGNYGAGGGGYGYGGGLGMGGAWLIIILIIAWFLFKDGHRDGFGGRECGCESNCQQDKWLDCKFDKVYEKECAIEAKIDANYTQSLRDRLEEKNDEVMMLKSQIFNDTKFGAIAHKLGEIECHMLKKPELRGVATTCEQVIVGRDCDDRPRRGRSDCDSFCG